MHYETIWVLPVGDEIPSAPLVKGYMVEKRNVVTMDWIEIKQGNDAPKDDRWILLRNIHDHYVVWLTDKDDYQLTEHQAYGGIELTHWAYIEEP